MRELTQPLLPMKQIALGACCLCLLGASAHAQDSDATAWSVFVDDGTTQCWGVSAPTESLNTRDGNEVSVQRGDILMFVTYRPTAGIAGELSFTGGYPFAEGSTVSLEVGGTTYELFTEGEWAWPATPDEDERLTNALRNGEDAVLTGRSSRGTVTRDTFSLTGFTAALQEAEARCTG